MIRKLKLKFITLAMTALAVLLTVIVTGMNVINYENVKADADITLSFLSRNRGDFPDFKNGMPDKLPAHISPELPYESRYFSVITDVNGNVLKTEMSRIASVDGATAEAYAKKILSTGRIKGFAGNYRFLCNSESGNTRIVFLDCGRELNSFRNFLYTSIMMAFMGLAVVFVVIFFCAGRMIRPIAESYEKQKRFITDAGHEIKTPLTIINANVDVLEMELGEGNECLEDIQLQTKRLTMLTNDLVMLARMEEGESNLQMIDFPLSEIVADAAMPFRTLAHSQGKAFMCDIQPTVTVNGNGKAISQLVNILMDNALKYSPEGGTVAVSLTQSGKTAELVVCNTTVDEMPYNNLSRVFDRFYRADESRNSETGGYGIGLSVAKAIVTAHGGKIQVCAPDPYSFKIIVTFQI